MITAPIIFSSILHMVGAGLVDINASSDILSGVAPDIAPTYDIAPSPDVNFLDTEPADLAGNSLPFNDIVTADCSGSTNSLTYLGRRQVCSTLNRKNFSRNKIGWAWGSTLPSPSSDANRKYKPSNPNSKCAQNVEKPLHLVCSGPEVWYGGDVLEVDVRGVLGYVLNCVFGPYLSLIEFESNN